MSNALNRIQALAEQAAETGKDMTQVVKGGGAARLLPAGYALGRFVEYHEFGKQPQEYNGQAKDPAMEVRLGFALFGANYANEDGTPYIQRTYNMALSQNEKAKAFLLFKAMNWKGTAKHFSQLLGQAFLVPIEHYTPKASTANPNPTPRSRINLKGFIPPLDPVTQSPYQVPEARDEDYSIFLWDYPTLEDFDALKIEGQNDDGKSKNYLQDMLLSAYDFDGSALQILLNTAQRTYVVPPKAAAPAGPATPPAAGPALPPPVAAAPIVPAQVLPAAPVAVPNVVVAAAVPTVSAAPVTAGDPPFEPTAINGVPVAAPAAPALPNLPVMPQV